MASSGSQIDKPQHGCPKRAELLDANINTGAQSINTERASLKPPWINHNMIAPFLCKQHTQPSPALCIPLISKRETGKETTYQQWVGGKHSSNFQTPFEFPRGTCISLTNPLTKLAMCVLSWKVTGRKCKLFLDSITSNHIKGVFSATPLFLFSSGDAIN